MFALQYKTMKYLFTRKQIGEKFPNFNGDLSTVQFLLPTDYDNHFIDAHCKKIAQNNELLTDIDPLREYNLGDRIHFISGHNDDLLYESIIFGFVKKDTDSYFKNGMLYVYIDCYWFPIKREAVIAVNI